VSAGYRDMISQLVRQIKDFASIGTKIAVGIIFSFVTSPMMSTRFFLGTLSAATKTLLNDFSIKNFIILPISFLSTVLLTLAIGSEIGIEGLRDFSSFMPDVYETLLAGRERYMAERIAEITEEHDTIVVITGAAHLTGLAREVKSRMPDARVESMTFLDLF
jgi:hypothetical protein